MSISDKIKSIFEGDVVTDRISSKAFQRMIEDGTFHRKYVFGVTQNNRGPQLSDPLKASGAVFVGKMGSGKSAGASFSVYTMQMASGDCTFFILLDPGKQLGDYTHIMNCENCASGKGRVDKDSDDPEVKDISSVIAGISSAYDEYLARSEIMGPAGFDNLKAWEQFVNNNNKKSIRKHMLESAPEMSDSAFESWYERAVPDDKRPIKMAYIVIVIEEAHALMVHPNFEFLENYHTQGSPANKLFLLSKVGRSYGISTFIVSQRIARDIPSDLLAGLNNKLCFLPSTNYDAGALNLEHASSIKAGESGKYANDDGFGQYPFMESDAIKKALDKYKKEYVGIHYGPSPGKIRDRMGNNGSIYETIKKMTFSEVTSNHSLFPLDAIASKFMTEAGYTIEKTDEKTPYELHAHKGDVKLAIKCVKEKKKGHSYAPSVSKERMDMIENHSKIKNNCDELLYFSISKGRGMSPGPKNEINLEQMEVLGGLLDNKKSYTSDEFFRMVSKYPIFKDFSEQKKTTPGPKKKGARGDRGDNDDDSLDDDMDFLFN